MTDDVIDDNFAKNRTYFIEIDDLRLPLSTTSQPQLVPDILFYNVPQHVRLLKELFKDVKLRQNILLIGNQGVGKNKLGKKFAR